MKGISKSFINDLFSKQILKEIHPQKTSDQLLNEGKEFDVFLSYPFSDKEYAIKLFSMLVNEGYKVYIDIGDEILDRKDVTKETATRLSRIMDKCRCLVYMYTKATKVSKWCQWELGYMSGKKNFRCATILLDDSGGSFLHQEYLDIYPFLSYEKSKENKNYLFWANDSDSEAYVNLKEFINGKNPSLHEER